MTEPISWKAIVTVAKAGNTIIDSKKRSELIKKFNLLTRKNRKIVVFGLSGAGKSQFINCLKKNLIIADRTDTTVKIKFKLEDFPLHFIDTPGQAAREFPRKQEVIKILKDGVEGIINVISYGYEENPEQTLDKIFDPNGDVKESFLKLNRKVEVERLAEWLPLIQPKDVNWIINLVSKADLWWEETDNVNNHYLNGEYNEAFDKINNYTNVMTMPFCSIIKPYYETKTSGKIGEIHKEQMHNHFINQLLNLLNTDK
jgi:energy-coupling factor transporter ATP-binding protein EcfA2